VRLAGVGVNTKNAPPSAAAYWSTAGFALGVRLALPLVPGSSLEHFRNKPAGT
jgi:hypothetical protein